MAKKIKYIAPIEGMSGNLSGNQVKLYAKNNNPAWDAPEGKQTAKGYIPRYVARTIASTGAISFSVKTRSTTQVTDASRKRMAAMAVSQEFQQQNGGAWPLSVLTSVQQLYLAARAKDSSLTWRKFFSQPIYDMLLNRRGSVTFYGLAYGKPNVVIYNPYFMNPVQPSFVLDKTSKNLVKFWLQLALYGAYMTIDNATGVCFQNSTFNDIISRPEINVLGLKEIEEPSAGETGAVMIGNSYVNYYNGDGAVKTAKVTQETEHLNAEGEVSRDFFLSDTFAGFEE